MTFQWQTRLVKSLTLAGLCLALAAASGCVKGKANVSGKVTFNKQNLTAGTISFIASGNRSGSGAINADGTYTVPDAHLGDVAVTITTPRQLMGPVHMGKMPGGSKGMPEEFQPGGSQAGTKAVRVVPVPDKYNSPDTSPLKFTVQKGDNTFNIDLTP